MFVACGIWCLADVSSVSPSSEQCNTKYIDLLMILNLGIIPKLSLGHNQSPLLKLQKDSNCPIRLGRVLTNVLDNSS